MWFIIMLAHHIFLREVLTEVVIAPVNVTVSENQAATLTCTLTGTTEAVKYFSWYYGKSSESNAANIGILTSSCNSVVTPINTSLYEYACPSNTQSSWTIKKVTKQNHGDRYQCNIETSSGNENSGYTFVHVQVPVSSVTMTVPSSASVTVNQGASTVFKCKTSGGLPAATVNWYKDSGTPGVSGDDIEISLNAVTSSSTVNDLIEVTSTLTYSPSKNDNGWGIYCTASNTNGQTPTVSQRKPLLNVQYAPDGPPVITGYTSVIEGTEGQLSCTVSGGNPAPTLTWDCINSGSSQTISSGTTTKVHTWMAERGQDRTCTCTASHYSGNKDVSIRVTVLYPPTKPVFKINSTPVSQTVKVIRHNSLSVSCSSEGQPEPSYIWTLPDRTTRVGSQLAVSNVQNNGRYTCDAQNTMDPSDGNTVTGNNSSFVDVLILYPPVIEELKNTSVVEGSQTVISCRVTFGNPPETTFKWIRNGAIWKTSQHVLINVVSRSDAMIYTCNASNSMQQTGKEPVSQPDTKSFYLNVLYNTTVTDFFVLGHHGETNVTLNESDPVGFQCNADSNPGSTISLIYKETVNHTKTDIKSATFSIGPAGCTDSGKYTCEGFNMYNVRKSIKHLVLNINCLPRPSPYSKLEQNVTSALHKPAVLTFTALAYPTPGPDDFRWYRYVNSTPLQILDNGQFGIITSNLQSNLTIVNVNHTYFGMYKLEVQNSIGMYQHYFYLSPEDIPEPPDSFQHVAETVSESTVTVEWAPGLDNGPAQTFVLRYKKMSESNWRDISVQDTGALTMNYTITGLSSGTIYYFTMYSYNRLGNSSQVEVIRVTTKNEDEGEPTAPVGLIVGGVAGGLACAALVVIGIILVRKCRVSKEKPEGRVELNGRRKEDEDSSDDEVITENAMYESASAVGEKKHVADNVYAKPVKKPSNDIYAVVNKTKSTDWSFRSFYPCRKFHLAWGVPDESRALK